MNPYLARIIASHTLAEENIRDDFLEWLAKNPSAAVMEDFHPDRQPRSPITQQRLDRSVVIHIDPTATVGFERVSLMSGVIGVRRLGMAEPFFIVDWGVLATQLNGSYFNDILKDIEAMASQISIVEILGAITPVEADYAIMRFHEGANIGDSSDAIHQLAKDQFRVTFPRANDERRANVTRIGLKGGEICKKLLGNPAYWVQFAQPGLQFVKSDRRTLMDRFRAIAGGDFRSVDVKNAWWIEAAKIGNAWGVVAKEVGSNWHKESLKLRPAVAVLDAAIDFSHPALWNSLRGGRDYTDGSRESLDDQIRRYRHGTSCAGLIAGYDPSFGFRGVAAGCGLYGIRVCSGASSAFLSPDETKTYAYAPTDYNIRGMVDALRDCTNFKDPVFGYVSVINMSLEVTGWSPGNKRYQALENAIREAAINGRGGLGCVVVVSAGNNSGNEDVKFPAAMDEVIAVASAIDSKTLLTPDVCELMRKGGNRCAKGTCTGGNCREGWYDGYPGSCYRPQSKITVAAPGIELWSTDSQDDGDIAAGAGVGNYARFGATSGAAPIVAGVAALMLVVNPDLTAARVKAILRETSVKTLRNCHRAASWDQVEFGFLDAEAAVRRALAERARKWGDREMRDL